MRTSELWKEIEKDPAAKLAVLKALGLTGRVNETRSGKLWRTHDVKNGVDHYKVYNLNDKVITRGVSK
jgi:hypothetical protein